MSSPANSPHALVAVGRPVRGEFTYSVPQAMRGKLQPGLRLRVPFGRASALGFYLAPCDAPIGTALKPIECILDATPALSAELVQLVRFAATHYRYPLGEALRSTLPPGLAEANPARPAKREVLHFAAVEAKASLMSLSRAPSQHAVLSYLMAVGGRADVEEVAHAIPAAKDSLRKLGRRGFIRFEKQEAPQLHTDSWSQARPQKLTAEQTDAVAVLTKAFDAGVFAPFLLHGVTGSGKTEVYLRMVERAVARNKGALILVPEIALTPQLVGRFRSRFGNAVAVLHSALKKNERLMHWQRLRAGEVQIAVGVRSAVFAPVKDVGLVVVDEEHDASFKQEDKLRYQARDLAVVRARQAQALIILGSATPSFESWENARRKRYSLLTLSQRIDNRTMPKVELVDLRVERPRTPQTKQEEPPLLSPTLRDAIRQTLEKRQQVILFLNRRGHSTFLVCEVCGQSLKCTTCDVCLTHHLSSSRLQCHYCGQASILPAHCPECRGVLLQLGAGTERVETEVVTAFPHARVARLDRDAVTSSERLTGLLTSFARREVDILVGTQMVAKGHDFPGVTLVCIVLADSALALPDFRAAERTFHILTQVAGRAGRGENAGRVLVQTYNPHAMPIACMLAGDFHRFTEGELQRRKALHWPPFGRMAALRIEGNSQELTAQVARRVAHAMALKMPPPRRGVRLLGPAPAPIRRIKGQTRWQLVVKGPTHVELAAPLDAAEQLLHDIPPSVKVMIDVDPSAML